MNNNHNPKLIIIIIIFVFIGSFLPLAAISIINESGYIRDSSGHCGAPHPIPSFPKATIAQPAGADYQQPQGLLTRFRTLRNAQVTPV